MDPNETRSSTNFPRRGFADGSRPTQCALICGAARALVFPSVWYEGQPLTVYVFLALGAPVIVSDICAGREAVAHGENGFWFRSSDVESLSEKTCG